MQTSFLFNFQMEKDETSWLKGMFLIFISHQIYLTSFCILEKRHTADNLCSNFFVLIMWLNIVTVVYQNEAISC